MTRFLKSFRTKSGLFWALALVLVLVMVAPVLAEEDQLELVPVRFDGNGQGSQAGDGSAGAIAAGYTTAGGGFGASYTAAWDAVVIAQHCDLLGFSPGETRTFSFTMRNTGTRPPGSRWSAATRSPSIAATKQGRPLVQGQ